MSETTILSGSSRSAQEKSESIVIPVRYYGYIQVLLTVWVIIWLVVEGFLAWNLIGILSSKTPPLSQAAPTMLFLAVFTVGGIFMIWRLRWVSRGEETIELTQTRLRVRRSPGGGDGMVYHRDRIQSLRIGSYARRRIYPSWGRQFIGKESYFIAFDYDGHPHEIARGINRRDAEHLVTLIRNALSGTT